MRTNNFFFTRTNTEVKYTEKYLNSILHSIVDEKGKITFEEVFPILRNHYGNIHLNKLAIEKYYCNEFGIQERTKIKRTRNEPNYFFGKQNTETKYTEEFLIKLISNILIGKKMSSKEIIDEVKNYYSPIKVNQRVTVKLIERSFPHKNGLYFNLNSIPYVFDDKFSYSNQIKELTNQPIDSLYTSLYKNLESVEIDLSKCLEIYFAIVIKENYASLSYISNLYSNIIENSETYKIQINTFKKLINLNNDEYDISLFISDRLVCKYMFSYGIFKVAELRNTSSEILLILWSLNLDKCLEDLDNLKIDYIKILSDRFNNYVNDNVNEKFRNVLLRRNGYFTNEGETLQEIGVELNITRERVRQIESKTIRILDPSKNVLLVNVSDELNTYFDKIFVNNNDFIEIKEFIKSFNQVETAYNILLLLKYGNSRYKLNEEYFILYDSLTFTVEDFENKVIKKFGNIFNASKLNNISEFERKVIDKYYSYGKTSNTNYHLKGFNVSTAAKDLIRKSFPNGYAFYNDSDYEKLVKEYALVFGEEFDVPSKTTIRGYINRSDDFCQIDKGRYIAREDCVEIPTYLFNEIFDFIVDHLPAVDYITIYNTFKKELNELGINNRYYLKGVLDYQLPDDLLTKRDYITESDNRQSSVQARIDYMRSFEGAFTVSDLRKKYPGVKDYVFQMICYNEEKNGLLQIAQKKYIYANKLNISEDHKLIIKMLVDEQLEKSDSNIITARKIYALMKMNYQNVLNDIGYIENQFSMFTIIKYLFGVEYFFDRPYISKGNIDNDRITTQSILIDAFNSNDFITYSDYKKFCLKMNIPSTISFNRLSEVLEDNFVQIEEYKLINKDLLDISQQNFKDIKQLLEMVLRKNNILDTKYFNGYMMLPNIGYKWNQYLLVGIVRSYLDEYEIQIEYQGKKFSNATYKIGRLENE